MERYQGAKSLGFFRASQRGGRLTGALGVAGVHVQGWRTGELDLHTKTPVSSPSSKPQLSRLWHFSGVRRRNKMEVVDATSLGERLRWEDSDYWLHLEAEIPFDKYPG